MIALFLADLVLIIHFLFIVFVIFGGLLVLKWRKVIYIHIPCAIWGGMIEFSGWICPLTYLENYFQKIGNADQYGGSFIEQYLLPVIYPPGLTAEVQIMLGIMVIVINLVIYTAVRRYNYSH